MNAVQKSYDAGVTDEFVVPVVCCKEAVIGGEDSVVFMNFRPDRARGDHPLSGGSDFTDVERKKGFSPLHYVCTTEYDVTMPNVTVAFPHHKLTNIFGEYISKLGLTQLRIAETEKYAHVTFFLQWRRGAGVSRRRPGAHPLSQGAHLRSQARHRAPARSRTPVWSGSKAAAMM